MSAGGLGVNEQTACDGSAFKLLARCYLNHSLAAAHKKNENEEKREYNPPSRTSIVDTTCVFVFWRNAQGMMPFFSHIAERLANRKKEPKSAWIKARLNFTLIRSILLCLPGTRTISNFDNIFAPLFLR